jgi:UDP-glucose 4-epimerase
MRVLVTGGAGFIGSNLVDRLLAEGCDVDVIDDLSTGTLTNLAEARAQRSRKFTFHRLDVRSPQLGDLVAHRRPEVIFHLAAQVDVRASIARPMFDAEVNVLGTLNLCEAALTAGTRKVVLAGSGGTRYGIPEGLPVRESHAQRPVSPYGVSKKAAGDYLHYYREVRGLEYTELALANVYGPRQDPGGEAGVVAIFAGQMLAGRRPNIYGDGEQTRDYLYVDDAVDAFVRATEKGGGLLVNIGTGVETTVRDLYDRIAALTGYAETPHLAPARMGDLERSCLDPGRAAIHLGWKPWTELDEGLGLTVDWFRAPPQS